MILAPLQKLPKNVGDLGKLIVAKGFKKFPKVQKIANSGHTGSEAPLGRKCSLSISIFSQIYPPSAANLNLASKQMDADVYLDDGITKLDVKNMKNDIQILLGRMRSKRPELVTVPR